MAFTEQTYWTRLLRRFRAREGLTQADVASRLGVDQTTVSRWERGLDEPGIRLRRQLRDLFREGLSARQDRVVRARVRHATWPSSLLRRGAVFLEINASALQEAGIADHDIRGRSIYGAFGPATDAVTQAWEDLGLFRGDVALTISLNVLEGSQGPVFLRTMDSPHFTAEGDVWCLSEIRRIDEADYSRMKAEFGGSTFALPFDALAR